MINRLLRNMSIRRKMTAVILLTCITALLVAGIGLFAVQVFTFRQNFTSHLQAIARIIADNSTAALTFEDHATAAEILSSLKVRHAVTYASIQLRDGSTFATYDPQKGGQRGGVMPADEGVQFHNNELLLTERIVLHGKEIGTLHIRADYGKELRGLVEIYGAILITVLTLAVLLAFSLSASLRRSILGPLVRLAETARAVAQNNDYSVRAKKFGEDEVGTFTETFNQMLEQIESQSAALREARDFLEVRVVERTAMLEKANAELTVATQEAAAANHAKSEFLSRVSHELRTPMNAILGFGQLLEMKEGLEAEDSESVAHILAAGRHLLGLIDEVLDISRIESGQMSLSPEAVDLRTLTQETMDLIRPLAARADVRIEQDVAEGSEWHVLADCQRLKQAMVNLLSNAIKYNHSGGKVTIRYERPEVSADETADNPAQTIRISVEDTGIGIAPEKLSRLFTAFDRLDAERTPVEGTGLGLALAKKMVDLMGGTLTVESTLGVGSCFSIELPSLEVPVHKIDFRRGLAPPATLSSPTRTIVYIEDNLANVKLIQQILTLRPGLKLLAAMQATIGLDLIREYSPDLVLLDLNLPDLSGHEVLARLRRDPKTRALPVVVVTADAARSQKERLLAAGANGYLPKPVNVPEFLREMDTILGVQAGN